MFTGWYCHIASFFTTKCHEDNVTFLAANKAKDCTGNIAQVLLGESHVLTSDPASEAAAPTNKEDSVLQAPRFCWVGEHQLFIMCFKAFDPVAAKPSFTLNIPLTQNTWMASIFYSRGDSTCHLSFLKFQIGHTACPPHKYLTAV